MSEELDFIDDGPSRPKNPGLIDPAVAPPPPSAQPDGEAPFNPFANVAVDTGQAGLGAPPSGPGPVATAAATVDPTPDAGLGGADDGARPARRDDLWTCPHCQVGNKPDRTTCRGCSKSPDEPVAKSWFLRPPVLGGAIAIMVVMIIIASRLGPDFSLQEPHRDNVTGSVMIDTAPARPGPALDGATFTPRGRIAGVGRVLAVSKQHEAVQGTVTVAIIFGREGAEGDLGGSFNASFESRDIFRPNRVPAHVSFAFIHLFDPEGTLPEIQPGRIISFSGDHGIWQEQRNWGTESTLANHEYLVHPWAGVRTGGP